MRWRAHSCLAAIVLFVISSCGPAGPAKIQSQDHLQPPPPDTTLGPGDVFDVRVYGEKDLSSTFRVASDGTIEYPLIGTIQVDGMTPTDVSKRIEDGLVSGAFLKSPQVSIFVVEYNSKKIYRSSGR